MKYLLRLALLCFGQGQTCLDYATSCTTDKSTIVQTLLESGTVQGKEIDEKYFTDKTTHNEVLS